MSKMVTENETQLTHQMYPLFAKTTQILFNTGNIVTSDRMKRLMQAQSSEIELKESIRSIIDSLSTNQHYESSSIVCRHKEYYEKLDESERDDVSISVKLFLNTLDSITFEKSIETILDELNVTQLDSLIISFPDYLYATNQFEIKDLIEPLWSKCEHLIDKKVLLSVGTSDLNKNLLEQLCTQIGNAKYLPSINQINLISCCKMPDDLKEYAKEMNIKLTTHNDNSKEILSASNLQSCFTHDYDSYGWMVNWCARYTLILKNRGIVKSKGYILSTQRELKYTK